LPLRAFALMLQELGCDPAATALLRSGRHRGALMVSRSGLRLSSPPTGWSAPASFPGC